MHLKCLMNMVKNNNNIQQLLKHLRIICHLRAVEPYEVLNIQHSDENTCSPAALTFMLIVWSHLWSNRNYWSKQFTGKQFCVPNTSLQAMCVKHPIALCNDSYCNDSIINIHNLSTHPLTQSLISTTNPSLKSH